MILFTVKPVDFLTPLKTIMLLETETQPGINFDGDFPCDRWKKVNKVTDQ